MSGIMEEIIKYIEQVKIKRSFFGFNRKDVYYKLTDMQNMFQSYCEESAEREKDLRSQIESLQQQLDQKTNKEIADECIQKANTNARLIMEQAKINAEFENLKLRQKQRAEKEKYEIWKQHTEAAGHLVLHNLKRVAAEIAALDDTLKSNMNGMKSG